MKMGDVPLGGVVAVTEIAIGLVVGIVLEGVPAAGEAKGKVKMSYS